MLGIVLMVAQLLLHLVSVSVVTSAAADAVHHIAAHGQDCGTQAETAYGFVRRRVDHTDLRVGCLKQERFTQVTVSIPAPELVGLRADRRIERTATTPSEVIHRAAFPDDLRPEGDARPGARGSPAVP